MSSWAKPGVKCVCVDDGNDNMDGYRWEDGAEIIKGAIYTVYSVWNDFDGDTVLDFVEVSRQSEAIEHWGEQLGYYVGRFRPLVELKDDIALFQALCPGLPVVPPAVVPPRVRVTSHEVG